MSIHFGEHDLGEYRVATEIYQGPLDLLLQLIERAELDITKLALAQVTDQYLDHIKNLPEQIADEISYFLVIAARLIQIKSEMLLPRPPVREAGEEDTGEALARQLVLYQKFRKAAGFLSLRQELALQTFLRIAPPARVEARLDLDGIDLDALLAAAREVYDQSQAGMLTDSLGSVVSIPAVTIRQKISLIANLLNQYRRVTFEGMLGVSRTRLEIVVTFLALLELVKLHFVHVRQESLFGEIEIETAEQWNLGEDIELEFGE